MAIVLNFIGLGLAGGTLVAILWSIAKPKRRIWPPQYYGRWTAFHVWVPTFALFGCIVGLGILGWNEMGLPNWVRFGVGGLLIVLGHLGVWYEVYHFGIRQTGGARGSLKTDGLYGYSRNPQYVSDILMIIGWLLLSAAWIALPTGLMAIAVLLAAPFAEEPWLEENYGKSYRDYKMRVRRFI